MHAVSRTESGAADAVVVAPPHLSARDRAIRGLSRVMSASRIASLHFDDVATIDATIRAHPPIPDPDPRAVTRYVEIRPRIALDHSRWLDTTSDDVLTRDLEDYLNGHPPTGWRCV